MDDFKNQSIASLQCYEPAGRSIDFREEDLLGHTIAIGGTGSGKTTRVIYPLLRELIRNRTERSDRVSLLVFDAKGDGEMARLLSCACRECGRLEDFVVVDGRGGAYLDVLDPLVRSWESGVESVAALLGSTLPRDARNTYWEMTFEILLRQTLRLHALADGGVDFAHYVQLVIDYLLHYRLRDERFTALIDDIAGGKIPLNASPALIAETISTHRMWETLDPRTRSILQSMAATVAGALNSASAKKYFTGSRPLRMQEVIASGNICLVSVDAVRAPEAARLLGCVLKGQWYDAVLSRPPYSGRMAGFVMDDWAMSVTGGTGQRYSDVDAMSLIRSRRGFVVAACHGLSGLDLVVGERSRRALIANFANLILFRSRDQELDVVAAAYFGERRQIMVDRSSHDGATQRKREGPPMKIEREVWRPCVPPGTLARLPTGDAIALIGSELHAEPMSLIPEFP